MLYAHNYIQHFVTPKTINLILLFNAELWLMLQLVILSNITIQFLIVNKENMISNARRGHCGRDRIVVGFTTYAISAYHTEV